MIGPQSFAAGPAGPAAPRPSKVGTEQADQAERAEHAADFTALLVQALTGRAPVDAVNDAGSDPDAMISDLPEPSDDVLTGRGSSTVATAGDDVPSGPGPREGAGGTTTTGSEGGAPMDAGFASVADPGLATGTRASTRADVTAAERTTAPDAASLLDEAALRPLSGNETGRAAESHAPEATEADDEGAALSATGARPHPEAPGVDGPGAPDGAGGPTDHDATDHDSTDHDRAEFDRPAEGNPESAGRPSGSDRAQATPRGMASANASVDPSAMMDAAVRATNTHAAPTHAIPSADAVERNASLDALSPELRARVDRVRERMSQEFGYDVDVIEGRRTQERQDHLFAQGRTRPGPVVTWTRESAHLDGHAVDVTIDGGFEDREAFRRLQTVAREEGLRTLGMKDPGHLELAVDADASDAPRTEAIRNPLRVANVARPAAVAGVARVADPFGPVRYDTVETARRDAAAQTRQPGSIDDLVSRAPVVDDLLPDAPALDIADRPDAADAGPAGEPVIRQPDAPDFSVEPPTIGSRITMPRPVTPIAGTSSVDQMARVLEMQELNESMTPSRISVSLGAGSPVSRINVGLLQARVDAGLGGLSEETARIMSARVDELYGALRDRGLELGSIDLAGIRHQATAGAQAAPGMVDGASELMRALFGSSADSGQRQSDRSPEGRDHFTPREDDARERRPSERNEQGDPR